MRLLRAIVPLLQLLPLLLLSGCGVAHTLGLDGGESRKSSSGDSEAIAYVVDIETGKEEGLDRRLRGLLERSSQLIALQDRPPFTDVGLRRRVDADIERFQDVLRSEGYYRAQVRGDVDGERKPPKVRLVVDPGPAFRLESFDVAYVAADDGEPAAPRPSLKDLGVELGTAARAPTVVAGEKVALRFLANRGRSLAEVVDRKIVVDHKSEAMRVHLDIDPGPVARFGHVSVSGLQRVKEDYVRVLIPWKQGDLYDQRLVERYRTRLLRTGLVAIDRADRLQGCQSASKS